MHLRNAWSGRSLVALSIVAALSLSGTVAQADRGHGHGHGKHKQRWRSTRVVEVVREPVVVERVRYVEPVRYVAPVRYVTYASPRVVVVRPTPYVHVGAQIGRVTIGAVFGPRATYADYDYGCNFCDARFNTFPAYDAHVHGCGYRPQNVQIVARGWDDQGYAEWRGRDPYACNGGYDRGYDREVRYDDGDWDD